MNTPIENLDDYIQQFKNFEELWKNLIALMPEVPHDYKEQDKWKSFAKRIWELIYNKNELEILINKTVDDKLDDILDDAIGELEQLQETLIDAIKANISNTREDMKSF